MKTAAPDNKASRLDDVFVSYSRKDKEFVRRLDKELRERGHEPWVDWDDLRPAEEFMQAIYRAIENADAFVFVLTPDSIASEVCRREVAHAVAQNKRMIPLVVRDVDAKAVPGTLAALNWIFCRDSDDFKTASDTLISALDTDLGWVRTHTRLLTRSIEWQAKGNSSSFALRGEDLESAEQWLAQAGADKERQPTPLQTAYILASRQGSSKRQRMLLGAVTAGALIALVLAVIARKQSLEAEKQRAEAVKQEGMAVAGRNRATGVIRFVQNNLPDKLRPIGRLELMDDVAVHVDKYYDDMEAAEGVSVETLTGKCWVAVNQGFIIEQQQGNLDEALVKFRSALSLAEKALLLDPSSKKALEYETKSRQVLELALQKARLQGPGKPAAAAGEKQKSPQTAGKPVAGDPADALVQSQLAAGCTAEALSFLEKRQPNEALSKFREAVAIQEKLAAQAPNDVPRFLGLAKNQEAIASILEGQGQFDSALAAFRDAGETIRKLTLIEPRNFEWQRALSRSYKHTGMLLQRHGQPALALLDYQKHAETMEKIAGYDPANRVWQQEADEALLWVARAYHDIVIAQFVAGKKGDFEAARLAVERGLGVVAALEKSRPLATDMKVLRANLENFGRQLPAPSE